jgi:hypothetical protein
MNRKEKLDRLLDIAPPVGAEFEVPEAPPRFVVLEKDESRNVLWIYLGDDLDELAAMITTSETRFVEHVHVHDLDADSVLAPEWKVERFLTLEDGFSYEDGYVSIP